MTSTEYKTSRLVVKNLPNTITGDKLRKLFSKDCEVTDLQLKFKQGGRFRNFAFVGYKSEDEAERVKEAMNNTCIGQNRICVEFCRKLGDGQKEKGKGKKKDGIKGQEAVDEDEKSLDSKGKEKKESIVSEFNELEKDPEFLEFIQTQRNISSLKQKVWQNDDVPTTNDTKVVEKKKSKENKESKKEEKEKETKTKPCVKGTFKFTVKIKRFPKNKCKKSVIKQFMAPLKPKSVRVVRNPKGMAFVSFETEAEMNKALSKDRNVFEGEQIYVCKCQNEEMKEEPKMKNPKDRVEKQVSEDVLVDTGRLFVRNLYYKCTEEELEKLFAQYGDIAEVHLPIDVETKTIKGFGFVTFVFPEHAIKAFSELDGTIFQGRTLHIIPGESKIEGRGANLEGKSSYKKQQELENRRKSGKGYNWNSLFLNPNAISEVISERYNVNKSQLLLEGKKEESIIVRMALAETQIVNEAARFLKENGVKLDAFSYSESTRSKTVFLIKNIPAKTEAHELREILEPYGTIKRFILPPLAVTAIVEADNPVEARAMFKKLAYLNFKLTPLYLEWAPVDVFDQKESTDSNGKNDQPTDESSKSESKSDQNHQTVAIEDDCEPETTILIKGLNFATTEEGISDHFSKCGKVASVTISKKKMSDGTLKSLGYGFIQFKERKAAQKAMKSLQSSVLDDRAIELQLSRVQKDKTDVIKAERAARPKITEQTGSKLAIRNIPFEATVKDIKQLFEAFGQLKFVRLPKRLAGEGTHRGFGFVEFVNKEDAKRAYEALSLSTHLLGRRLVLEWAAPDANDGKESESLETATKRVRYFIDTEPAKQFKKSALVEDLNKSKKKKFADDFDDM